MIKRFNSLGEALRFAREYHRDHTHPVYVMATSLSSYVAGPSSRRFFPVITGRFICGTYCPEELNPVVGDPNLEERPPLRGNGEYWYNVAACHSSDIPHETVERVALAAMDNDSCIWHEFAREFRQSCQCARCRANSTPRPAAQ